MKQLVLLLAALSAGHCLRFAPPAERGGKGQLKEVTPDAASVATYYAVPAKSEAVATSSKGAKQKPEILVDHEESWPAKQDKTPLLLPWKELPDERRLAKKLPKYGSTVERLLRLSMESYRKGAYDLAEGYLDKIMEISPFVGEAYVLLGKIYLLKGAAKHDQRWFEQAQAMLRMGQRLDPEQAEITALLNLLGLTASPADKGKAASKTGSKP